MGRLRTRADSKSVVYSVPPNAYYCSRILPNRIVVKLLHCSVLLLAVLAPCAAPADCLNPVGPRGKIDMRGMPYRLCDGTHWQTLHPVATGAGRAVSACALDGEIAYDYRRGRPVQCHLHEPAPSHKP
jgi:hypothetical protein